jgi:two-component system phosphate regulon response regulator PhoB
MTFQGNLLLAVADRELAEAARLELPAANVTWLPSSVAPPPLPDGRVWCFVDWLLPDRSGLELCRRLRLDAWTARAHITLVLEDLDDDSRRRALKAGADDYLLGPLGIASLVSRLDRLVADGPAPEAAEGLRLGPLQVDAAAHRVCFEGRPVDLKPRQFDLLLHFMRHPNRVHSRVSLLRLLGADHSSMDERTVDVWVGRLRSALQSSGLPPPIRTVKGYGYVFDML